MYMDPGLPTHDRGSARPTWRPRWAPRGTGEGCTFLHQRRHRVTRPRNLLLSCSFRTRVRVALRFEGPFAWSIKGGSHGFCPHESCEPHLARGFGRAIPMMRYLSTLQGPHPLTSSTRSDVHSHVQSQYPFYYNDPTFTRLQGYVVRNGVAAVERAGRRCERGLPAIPALRARPSDSPAGPLSARRRATRGVASPCLLTMHLPDAFLADH